VQLSTFAFFVKNVVRQRALQRLAARVQLLGTGMAFPWSAFARAKLATSSIVEDLKLGQELAWAGYPPLFVEAAQIWSGAETQKNTLSQRRRWEGGFLQNSLRVGPMFLVRSLAHGDFRSVWAAVNLMIPPIALLIFLDCLALIAAAFALPFVEVKAWPILMLSSAIALACLGLICAWRAGGARFVTFGTLVRVPLYILWKLPIYAGLVREGAPKSWLRTERGS